MEARNQVPALQVTSFILSIKLVTNKLCGDIQPSIEQGTKVKIAKGRSDLWAPRFQPLKSQLLQGRSVSHMSSEPLTP